MSTTIRQSVTVAQVPTGPEAPLHPIYHRYPRQTEPQGAYIELRCSDGCLRADWNGEIGNAVPMDVYRGHTLRWGIHPEMPAQMINELLRDLAPLAERVIAGYSPNEWDGHNFVAAYSEDAQDATEEIEIICDDYSSRRLADLADGGVWSAGDWLDGGVSRCLEDGTTTIGGWEDIIIRADTTDEELQQRAAELEAEARSDGITLEGTLEFLEHCREDHQDDN